MDFFKRHFFVALSAVLGLIIIAFVGARGNLQLVFGVVVPYMAALIFVEGVVYRVIQWARSPVPFRIPTTGGQGRTLPWIKRDLGEKLDNPSDFPHLIGRMALEVLAFRSLFRNLRTELVKDPDNPEGARLIHWSYKWLWLGAIAFHYAFLVVILRHLRFFTEPVPFPIILLCRGGRLLPVLHAGGVPERRGAGGGGGLPAVPADHQSDPALHLPGGGLLPPAPDPGHRPHRDPHAVLSSRRTSWR